MTIFLLRILDVDGVVNDLEDVAVPATIDVRVLKMLVTLVLLELGEVLLRAGPSISVLFVTVMFSVSPVLAIVGPEQEKQWRLKCTTPRLIVG